MWGCSFWAALEKNMREGKQEWAEGEGELGERGGWPQPQVTLRGALG